MKLILTFVFTLLLCVNVYCNEAEDIVHGLELDEAESTIEENTDISFRELLTAVVKGEDIVPIIKKDVLSFLKGQLGQSRDYIKTIILISIVCALINMLSHDIKDKSVSDIINLTGQIIILGIASVSLKNSINVLQECIQAVTDIINSLLPAIIAISSFGSGGSMGGGALLSMGTSAVAMGTNAVIVPMLIMGTLLRIVNIISDREILNKLSKLIEDGTSLLIRLCAYSFVFIMGLERISGGVVSRSAGSMIKSGIKMIPVIGDILGGAGDIAITAISAVGNALGMVTIAVIAVVSLFPIAQIALTAFVYKLTAALLEPVCDKATIEVIDTVGEANFKILASLFTVNIMFVISAAVLLCSVR